MVPFPSFVAAVLQEFDYVFGRRGRNCCRVADYIFQCWPDTPFYKDLESLFLNHVGRIRLLIALSRKLWRIDAGVEMQETASARPSGRPNHWRSGGAATFPLAMPFARQDATFNLF
jgi:hypothetical protein